MSTKNSANAKTKNAEVKNESAKIEKINVNSIIAGLADVDVKEKNSLSRKGLYRYSESELQEIAKDKDVSKKIRNTSRRKTDNFLNQIALFLKQNNLESATEKAKSFIEYYKERFLLNDFSLDSVRESSSLSEYEVKVYSASLTFCKTII